MVGIRMPTLTELATCSQSTSVNGGPILALKRNKFSVHSTTLIPGVRRGASGSTLPGALRLTLSQYALIVPLIHDFSSPLLIDDVVNQAIIDCLLGAEVPIPAHILPDKILGLSSVL